MLQTGKLILTVLQKSPCLGNIIREQQINNNRRKPRCIKIFGTEERHREEEIMQVTKCEHSRCETCNLIKDNSQNEWECKYELPMQTPYTNHRHEYYVREIKTRLIIRVSVHGDQIFKMPNLDACHAQ